MRGGKVGGIRAKRRGVNGTRAALLFASVFVWYEDRRRASICFGDDPDYVE
jgi:hypothetical protein